MLKKFENFVIMVLHCFIERGMQYYKTCWFLMTPGDNAPIKVASVLKLP